MLLKRAFGDAMPVDSSKQYRFKLVHLDANFEMVAMTCKGILRNSKTFPWIKWIPAGCKVLTIDPIGVVEAGRPRNQISEYIVHQL